MTLLSRQRVEYEGAPTVPALLDVSPAALRSGYAGIVLAAASWGSWSVFLRLAQAAQPVSPALCSFVVMSTIALVLCPLALRATRRRAFARSRREWALIAAFGVTDALNCVLFFSALSTTSVAVAVLTHYLAPLLVAVGAPLVLGERRRPGTVLAVSIGLSGLTLLLSPWEVTAQPDGKLVAGAMLGSCSALFYAASLLINKRLSQSFEASELLVYHMPSALVLVALLVPAGGWVIPAPSLAWLVLGALGPGALAGVVFMRSLVVVPAAHASVLTLVEPVTALAVGVFVWRESLHLGALLGGVAILTAAYLVVHEARVHELESASMLPPNG
jgi:drug/metabolite transporter (DMT)-like permease